MIVTGMTVAATIGTAMKIIAMTVFACCYAVRLPVEPSTKLIRVDEVNTGSTLLLVGAVCGGYLVRHQASPAEGVHG